MSGSGFSGCPFLDFIASFPAAHFRFGLDGSTLRFLASLFFGVSLSCRKTSLLLLISGNSGYINYTSPVSLINIIMVFQRELVMRQWAPTF